MKFNLNKKGFSLLEFIIYIAIISGVALVVGGSFISITTGSGKAQARYAVNSNLRYALNRIAQDIKDADRVITPVFTVSSTTLTLQLNNDQVAYSIDTGRLVRSYDEGSDDDFDSEEAITSTDVSVLSATFRTLANLRIGSLQSAVGVSAVISADYSPTSTSNNYSSTLSKAILVEKPSNWPARGSFGVGGGGSPAPEPCLSILPDDNQKSFFVNTLLRVAHAAPNPCDELELPDGVTNLHNNGNIGQ